MTYREKPLQKVFQAIRPAIRFADPLCFMSRGHQQAGEARQGPSPVFCGDSSPRWFLYQFAPSNVSLESMAYNLYKSLQSAKPQRKSTQTHLTVIVSIACRDLH
jgi:hypothetical protein